MTQVNCRQCGKSFVTNDNRARGFCSRRCSGAAHRVTDAAGYLMTRGKADGDCWIWTGSKNKKGYGTVNLSSHKTNLVTRVIWEIFRGAIPDGMLVCHICDNPICFKIEHLFLGTHADNSADMVRKGRSGNTRGEKSGKAKITEAQVAEMRTRRAAGELNKTIAASFGLHPAHVSRLTRGKRWGHLNLPIAIRTTASGVPGVTRAGKKWRALVDGVHVGVFPSIEEARAAREAVLLKRRSEAA